jgi:hypothetical protein
MKYIRSCFFLLFSFLMAGPCSFGQESVKTSETIKFFLDCEDCDFTFVRQELPFVSFVRDPNMADVHILVTDSQTGGGGHKYFLNFIGLRELKDQNHDYTVISQQSDTDDDVRKALLKILKIGILNYYSATPFINSINIDLEEAEGLNADNLVSDKWKKWLFSLESGGEFQKEESQNQFSITSEAAIKKVTDAWKTAIEGLYEINREKYIDDEDTIFNRQDAKELGIEFIKSLTDKWSAGIFLNYESRTYLNIENSERVAAGIEYNFFPWKECNRRVLAIRYTAGAGYVDYIEETLYEKMKEILFSEALELKLELIQPWGEVSVGLEGRNYFHDFSKNRVTLESDISIRLSKHFSVYCEMQSEMIHDQLYLPKGDATHDDILLKRRQLATNYQIEGRLGFRFTFGSIYNNVVNERF